MRKNNDLVYGLTEQAQYRFYQAHHLTQFCMTLAEGEKRLEIDRETVAVVMQLLSDLIDPSQFESLNAQAFQTVTIAQMANDKSWT